LSQHDLNQPISFAFSASETGHFMTGSTGLPVINSAAMSNPRTLPLEDISQMWHLLANVIIFSHSQTVE